MSLSLPPVLATIGPPGDQAALHLRACDWHAAHGDLPDAIQHALDAKGFDRAAALITEAMTDMFQRSELLTKLLNVLIADGRICSGHSEKIHRNYQGKDSFHFRWSVLRLFRRLKLVSRPLCGASRPERYSAVQ